MYEDEEEEEEEAEMHTAFKAELTTYAETTGQSEWLDGDEDADTICLASLVDALLQFLAAARVSVAESRLDQPMECSLCSDHLYFS